MALHMQVTVFSSERTCFVPRGGEMVRYTLEKLIKKQNGLRNVSVDSVIN